MPWGLTPRLPMSFDSRQAATSGRFVVVAGVPGTGKSTLAYELGRTLEWPVFSTDWLMGALTPFGGRSMKQLGDIGDELGTTLVYRQLVLGQSAILDTPGENQAMRARWSSMARAFGVRLSVVVCTCSDEVVHKERLEQRARGIPGWHDGGRWDIVKPRRDAFRAWDDAVDDVLVVDAIHPVEQIAGEALAWIRGGCGTTR